MQPSFHSPRRIASWSALVLTFITIPWLAWAIGGKVLRDRAAAHLRQANSRTVQGLNLDLVWIAPGEFTMGIPEPTGLTHWIGSLLTPLKIWDAPIVPRGIHERPLTQVRISKPFWLGKVEGTQSQWWAVMATEPLGQRSESMPIGNVTWDESMEFCRKLTEREHVAGRLPPGYRYTLPTEAQWENACRAGTTGDDGGNGLNTMGWFAQNTAGITQPVATKPANAWGLHDMHGNVQEWCFDWYATYPGGMVTDPIGPASGTQRIARGGTRSSYAFECGSGMRNPLPPAVRDRATGFRLALTSAP